MVELESLSFQRIRIVHPVVDGDSVLSTDPSGPLMSFFSEHERNGSKQFAFITVRCFVDHSHLFDSGIHLSLIEPVETWKFIGFEGNTGCRSDTSGVRGMRLNETSDFGDLRNFVLQGMSWMGSDLTLLLEM